MATKDCMWIEFTSSYFEYTNISDTIKDWEKGSYAYICII